MHVRRLLLTTLLALAAALLPAAAQAQRPDPSQPAGPELERPPGWQVRLDHPDPEVEIGGNKDGADIWFVTMTPGWHITTGPAAIFYHPASTAEGRFRAETRLHLFNPGERKEGYGLFFAGRDLEGEGQAYVYFLLRNTGEFLIKRRAGSETHTLHPWTAHEAIVRYDNPEESSVTNTLAVEVGAEEVRFEINGQPAASLPKKDLGTGTDGLVGLRINHHLNLHISELKVEELSLQQETIAP